MDPKLLDSLIDQLEKQRREWTREGAEGGDAARRASAARKNNLKEKTVKKAKNLDDKKSDTMREVDAVLKRIETGKFGICEKCGSSIQDERLSANPSSRFCSACAAKERTEEPTCARGVI
jgi:RNA polymerase-binding transcription factor DksA